MIDGITGSRSGAGRMDFWSEGSCLQFWRQRPVFSGTATFLSTMESSFAASACPHPSQVILFAALLALVGWSSYAVARILTPAPAAIATTEAAPSTDYAAQVAQLAAETERRVQLIEQRQMALAAALASENVDVASLRRLGFYPPQAGHDGRRRSVRRQCRPDLQAAVHQLEEARQSASGAIAVPSDKPVKTAAFTSGYGVRSDPFRGGAAMHAGIDLAGPVRHADLRDRRRHRSAAPAGTAAATATSSRSTMAAASKPVTATCRRSSFSRASTSRAAS